MADLGQTLYVGETTPYITRADGYAPSDGYRGYSYNFQSFIPSKDVDSVVSTESVDYTTFSYPTPPPGTIIYYVMRGRDVDCGPITYRTWTVTGSPDTTGLQYSGPKCGANPLADITVVFTYTR